MKVRMNGTVVLSAFVTALLCASPALAKKTPTDTRRDLIKIKVNDPGDANASLEAVNANTEFGCNPKKNPRKGCVVVPKGYAADMLFRLQGNPKCSDGNEWALTGVDLAGYKAGEDSAAKPAKDDWGKPIAAVAAKDFDADKNTGEVNIAVLNKSTIRMHDRSSEVYTIWYRVKASCNGRHIYLDPEVKNKG